MGLKYRIVEPTVDEKNENDKLIIIDVAWEKNTTEDVYEIVSMLTS